MPAPKKGRGATPERSAGAPASATIQRTTAESLPIVQHRGRWIGPQEVGSRRNHISGDAARTVQSAGPGSAGRLDEAPGVLVRRGVFGPSHGAGEQRPEGGALVGIEGL
jgi:hypothetical protein